MRRVWLFPIEPLEERYSADWLRWWPGVLHELGVDHSIVMGTRLRHDLGGSEFLNPVDTHFFKATQLADFCAELHNGAVQDGDVVLLCDAWNAELTSLAYMRDAGCVRFKIVGIFHAGCWDEHDFLSRVGMTRWARDVERGWFAALDAICVATEFHKELITKWGCDPAKMFVTGLPLYPDCVTEHRSAMMEQKSRTIVFPHRLAPEKQPDEFDRLRERFVAKYDWDDTKWVRTKDLKGATKSDYYDALASAKVVFSSALQETWGIAMIEAMLLGCWPVAPNRLSYPETIGEKFPLYTNLDEAAALVHQYVNSKEVAYYDNTRWEAAISRVVGVIRSLAP
jgi:glycosyltransferase involved in cell wall biosynthesis